MADGRYRRGDISQQPVLAIVGSIIVLLGALLFLVIVARGLLRTSTA